MYEIMKKTDAISQILPQTVERLLTLSDIHQQGKIILMYKCVHTQRIYSKKNIAFQLLPSVNL